MDKTYKVVHLEPDLIAKLLKIGEPIGLKKVPIIISHLAATYERA